MNFKDTLEMNKRENKINMKHIFMADIYGNEEGNVFGYN